MLIDMSLVEHTAAIFGVVDLGIAEDDRQIVEASVNVRVGVFEVPDDRLRTVQLNGGIVLIHQDLDSTIVIVNDDRVERASDVAAELTTIHRIGDVSVEGIARATVRQFEITDLC